MFKYALKIVLVLLGFSVGSVYALGIGNIKAETALNEPLKAIITLRDTSGVRADEISVTLAPIAEFQTTGIDFASFLNDLRFSVLSDSANSPQAIVVSSSKPIREPYVNFLLSVRWPNGRLLKEYTVLLDPVFGDSNLVSSSVPIAQQISKGKVESWARQIGQPTQAAQQRLTNANDQPGTVTVLRDDTMWEIAQRVAPAGVSVHQTMHAIKAENPNAFIDNNINRVKAGYILNVPTRDEIEALNPQVAAQATQRDFELWTGGASASSQSSQVVSSSVEGELTLAAAKDISQSDTVALEKISSLESENAELNDRLQSLEQQLTDLGRLLELKNAQLAAVQEQSAASIDAQVAVTTPETTAVDAVDEPQADVATPVATAGEAAQIEVIKGAMPPGIEPEQPLWMNPVIQLAVLGAILIALVIAMLFTRRKNSEQTVELEDVGIILDSEKDVELPPEDETFIDLPEDIESEENAQDLAAVYGDKPYAHAKAEIEQRIENEAHRADLQLYLLQLAAKADDKETFVSHFRAFEAIGKSEDVDKARNILSAVRGNADWLEGEVDFASTMIAVPEEPQEESDEFFKDIVHEAELTDEIAALLEASEGATSLDQADIEEMSFDELVPESDNDAASIDETVFEGSDDTLEFDAGALEVPSEDVPEAAELSQDDDDGLDFDLGDLDLGAEPNSASSDTSNDGEDAGDLNFESTLEAEVDSFSETMVIPPKKEPVLEADEDGLDFDLGAESLVESDDESVDASDLDDLLGGLSLGNEEDSSSVDELDDLLGDLSFDDDTGVGVDADDASSEEDLPNEAEASDDLAGLLDDLELDEAAPSIETVQSEPEQEGDIIDLSDFIDASDDVAFDTTDIEEAPAEDIDLSGSDDFDDLDDLTSLLAGDDDSLDSDEEMNTKLGMAEAFIEMGDAHAAKEALNEVIEAGQSQHREAARGLLAKLGG